MPQRSRKDSAAPQRRAAHAPESHPDPADVSDALVFSVTLIAASLYLIIRSRDAEEADHDRLVISSYQGTINSSVFRTAEIFRPVIIRNFQGLIL